MQMCPTILGNCQPPVDMVAEVGFGAARLSVPREPGAPTYAEKIYFKEGITGILPPSGARRFPVFEAKGMPWRLRPATEDRYLKHGQQPPTGNAPKKSRAGLQGVRQSTSWKC